MTHIDVAIPDNRLGSLERLAGNKPDLLAMIATELYDHREDTSPGKQTFDGFEVVNLAHEAKFAQVVVELRSLLKSAFGSWPVRNGPGPDHSDGNH
eukprot:COSAG02_NODE_19771_length_865_cov_1.139687_2_plen_96_part_00